MVTSFLMEFILLLSSLFRVWERRYNSPPIVLVIVPPFRS